MAPEGVVRRLAVVADDLTGAADAAAPFAARGFSVAVALGDDLPDADVVAVSTGNRGRDAATANACAKEAVARLRGAERLFVKVDSTLRGQVHADVAGALAAWEPVAALATPAFPAQGRVVRDGTLLVHGEPTVPRVGERFPDGVTVVDAAEHADLVALARRIVDAGAVAVGSGGLSRALAEVLGHPAPTAAVPPATGVLIVVGTPHPTSRGQLAHLTAEPVTVSQDAPATVLAALRAGSRVVLTCDPGGPVEPESPAAEALATEVAATVAAVLRAEPGTGLVLTGGTTALAVATALDAGELRLHGEVAPGLPLGVLVTGRRRIPVVTKSGGFGAPDALDRAAEALEAQT